MELLMKTFNQFMSEAYSQSERESHKVKPKVKKYHLKTAPIDMNYRKYNMPMPIGNYKKPTDLDV